MSELSVQKVTGVVDINVNQPVSFANSLIISANTSADALTVTQAGSGTALTANGDILIQGSARRIRGDFSNATVANRVAFQTSATNTFSLLGVLPNGTGNISGFTASNNSDPTNASIADLRSTPTDVSLRSNISGTGTYLPLTFYTTATERMRIDANGNVGIGTTSPSNALTVTRSSGESIISVRNTGTDSAWLTMQPGSSGAAYIHNIGNTSTIFTTNGAERMRIDPSGNLLVGTTTARGKVTFEAGGTTPTILGSNFTGTGTAFHIVFKQSGSDLGAISTNGSSTTYATTSDYRLKENVKPMQNALAKVALLNPVTFKWKIDGSDGQGFIAHELQSVVPDCVTGEKDVVDADGNPIHQGVDTSFLVATLTKAIQEQQAQIEALTARIEALESK